jgi:hypothetical protein
MTSYKLETAVGFAIATLGVVAYMQMERQRALVAQQRLYIEQQQALVAQLSQVSPIREDQAASALHAKAWGKPWPQSEGTISKTEMSGSVDDDDDDENDEYNLLADKLKVPPSFKYRYFKEIQGLKSALGASPGRDFRDVLVVRDDYKVLHEVLYDRREYGAIVVTGHPGIGSYQSWFSSLKVEC